MSDISLTWSDVLQTGDLGLFGPDLLTDDGLETAISISLFTDRRADADDVLPGGSTDRRGWFGDAFAEVDQDRIGSKLWMLDGRTINAETLRLAEAYAAVALQWLVADQIAKTVTVTAVRNGLDRIDIQVSFTRPDGGAGRYDYVWEAMKPA